MSRIIGIDLGTTTTEAAVFVNGAVKMIPNPDGTFVTPSAVYFDDSDRCIVGEEAKAAYSIYPEKTVIEVKRKLGSGEKIKLGKKSYTPVEISAEILKYVKEYASNFLGEEINRAVISVPAYFNDIQRREVVAAGTLAGFTVERIINEPTAASLCYGIEHMEEESYVLVYDLGGGTFDVTLLEMFDGVLEVRASAGDNALGGKDFDQALIDWFNKKFEEEHNISLAKDVYAQARLKAEAEKCKIALSTQEAYKASIPMITVSVGKPLAFECTVTRELFEQLIMDIVARTHMPVKRVLSDGKVNASDLKHILLVGGSTRIPLVAKDIEQLLGNRPDRIIDPDFSVASGAAIHAAAIAGSLSEDQDVILTDVCAYTLGVRAATDFTDDHMSVIIPRNTTIPVTRKEFYSTYFDNQTRAQISVYQGEAPVASENHLLGEFWIEGIPPKKAGKESVTVEFSYNQNGILDVRAVIESTGEDRTIQINMMDVADKEEIDVSNWKDAAGAAEYRTIIRKAERLLKSEKKKGEDADEEWIDDVEELLYELKLAIIQDDLEEADELEEELRDCLDSL